VTSQVEEPACRCKESLSRPRWPEVNSEANRRIHGNGAALAFILLFGGLVGALAVAGATEGERKLSGEQVFARFEARLRQTSSYRQFSVTSIRDLDSGEQLSREAAEVIVDLETGRAFTSESKEPATAFMGLSDRVSPGSGPRPQVMLLQPIRPEDRDFYRLVLSFQHVPGSELNFEELLIDASTFDLIQSYSYVVEESRGAGKRVLVNVQSRYSDHGADILN